MDKDVQARLAALEEKVDLLLQHLQVRRPVEYSISFGTVDGDASELRRMLCTMPPIRGD